MCSDRYLRGKEWESDGCVGYSTRISPHVMLFLDSYEEYNPDGDIYDV